jgi:hypothetical protein
VLASVLPHQVAVRVVHGRREGRRVLARVPAVDQGMHQNFRNPKLQQAKSKNEQYRARYCQAHTLDLQRAGHSYGAI